MNLTNVFVFFYRNKINKMNECDLVIDSKKQNERKSTFTETISINSITLMILIEIFRDLSRTETRTAYSSL